MEFEKDAPTSDTDRRLAEAKKLTLQPLHADITPDAPQDSEIAARHMIEPPIANATNDTEEYESQVLPTQSLLNAQSAATPQTYKRVVGLTVGAVVFATLAIFALLK
ncbi:MAG: hypothetical protein JWM07_279 [Candidatus Saccharibacteria bacterium]|nr:hypothetical protein [Candidatus Saccharibacteria bacterium]